MLEHGELSSLTYRNGQGESLIITRLRGECTVVHYRVLAANSYTQRHRTATLRLLMLAYYARICPLVAS